ncbi:MAG: mannose-6-phosphate isomerase, class I [Bacteroidota bacterium]|nr:mannose-6-phosphate isomerase, class I [Bacteroidota bacterium]
MSFMQEKILLLKGKVQHYAWGGYDFIPAWLGIENKEHQPFAEYWLGAHPLASATVVTPNGELSLQQLIADYPQEFLSISARQQFGELPYLMKILDVRDMLSIQVHPTKEGAAMGFEKEESEGVLLGASERNYKDKNHKPEVMVALSDFWLLHGFLTKDKLKAVLLATPEFEGLSDVFADGDYKALYERVMNHPQTEVNHHLMPLVKREIERKQKDETSKSEPGWWVAKLFENDKEIEDIDRGIYSIYFFNIVNVKEGEGVFQGAGLPHAYLEGQNAELMANSDNVLRGGLTPKHIDVPELMKHTSFEGIVPNVMKGEKINENEKGYPCPVPDFGIHKITLKKNEKLKAITSSLEIWMVIKGSANIEGSNVLPVHKGQSFAVLPNEHFTIIANDDALLYKAFVPEA